MIFNLSQRMSEKSKYIPIDCNYYDVLVLHAMHRDHLRIQMQIDEKIQKIEGVIADLFTKEKEEFVSLKDGRIFRLDQVQHVEKID